MRQVYNLKLCLKVSSGGESVSFQLHLTLCNLVVPGSGRASGEGNGKPTPLFLPGEFHGQRNLVGSSPWGHKESDRTEPLNHHP